MLDSLFSLCKKRKSCLIPDYEKIVESLEASKYEISHYTTKDPLYEFYSKYIHDNAQFFSSDLCRGKLTKEYISSTQIYEPVLTIARMMDVNDGNVQIKGFVQSNIRDDKHFLYIRTLCASKNDDNLGTLLLESIIAFAKTLHPIEYVKLMPINSAKGFYLKHKFTGSLHNNAFRKTLRNSFNNNRYNNNSNTNISGGYRKTRKLLSRLRSKTIPIRRNPVI